MDSTVLGYVLIGALVVLLVVLFVLSSRKNKKKQQEAENLINAVKPGNKVKTIGGICGIVVEVDSEENTFVLETGTEQSGKCYIKFDKQAIYQTDAVVEKAEAGKGDKAEQEGVAAGETSGEVAAEVNAEPAAEVQTEQEAPAEAEAKSQDSAPAKKSSSKKSAEAKKD